MRDASYFPAAILYSMLSPIGDPVGNEMEWRDGNAWGNLDISQSVVAPMYSVQTPPAARFPVFLFPRCLSKLQPWLRPGSSPPGTQAIEIPRAYLP